MFKKLTLIALSVVVASLLITSAAIAAKTKYEFSDVLIDDQTVEIEASFKDNKNNNFSSCSYYSDDYEEWLGQYQEDVVAGELADEVEQFCVNNFANLSQ